MTHRFSYVTARPGAGAAAAAVAEYWCIDAERCSASVEAVLPDAAVGLYFNLGPLGRHEYVPATGEPTLAPRAAWVAGPHARTMLVAKEVRACHIVGVRLHVGAARAVLGVPAASLAGQIVDLDEFWRADVDVVRDRLATAPSDAARLAVIDDVFTARLARGRAAALVLEERQLCRAISEGVAPRVGDIARALGLSHRALIAHCDTHVGLKPKAVHAVSRLRRILAALHGGRRASWARLAADAGYFDQAHFAHDFQRRTGFTPADYEARRTSVGVGFARYRLATPA